MTKNHGNQGRTARRGGSRGDNSYSNHEGKNESEKRAREGKRGSTKKRLNESQSARGGRGVSRAGGRAQLAQSKVSEDETNKNEMDKWEGGGWDMEPSRADELPRRGGIQLGRQREHLSSNRGWEEDERKELGLGGIAHFCGKGREE